MRMSENDITKIMQNLDPNKAHVLLECIFRECLNTGLFPLKWKKGSYVPVYIKSDKQYLKNYRPVSLFPVCSKSFEKFLFNGM